MDNDPYRPEVPTLKHPRTAIGHQHKQKSAPMLHANFVAVSRLTLTLTLLLHTVSMLWLTFSVF